MSETITLPLDLVRDRRLSPDTRGALAYLLSESDRRRVPDLLMAHGIGKSRAFRIIRELKGAGYLRVHAPRKRPDGTHTGWWYDLASRPVFNSGGRHRSGDLTCATPPRGVI